MNYEPPKGEGYQLWETTSEGSPITPVFKTLGLLCQYCEDEKITVFSSHTATKEEWEKMLSDGIVKYESDGITFI